MIQAINLKIAYMKNPIGIDEKNPVLTWKCRDAIKQSAYEIEYNVQSFGAECRETKIIRANTDIMEFRFEDKLSHSPYEREWYPGGVERVRNI